MIRRKTQDPWLFCSVDYAALELATLAQCCLDLFGRSKMADAINAGQDLHARLAARIAGIPYEEAVARRKAKDVLITDLRQASKPVNFGVPGLMGAPKIVFTARKDGVFFCELAGRTPKGAKPGDGCRTNTKLTEWGNGRGRRKIAPTCEVCLELAAHYKNLYFEEFPEVAEYHECTIAQAEECEAGIPLESFGSGMLRLETSANAVSNHFFQNRAAQGAKHAGWKLAKEAFTDRRSVLFNNLRPVVFVHDEVMSEIREAVAHEAAWRKSEIMVAAMQEKVPDVKITAEPALMRRWFKGADKVVGKDGRLKPWWPKDKKCPFPAAPHADGCSCWTWAPDQELMAADVSHWAP